MITEYVDSLLWRRHGTLAASCRGRGRGPHSSGVKPIGCVHKFHHIAKQNIIGSARIACLCHRNDIYNLTEVLEFPELFKCYNGVVVDKVEAFCLFLKRFAYPYQYADLVTLFARPIPQLCMATNEVMNLYSYELELPTFNFKPTMAFLYKFAVVCQCNTWKRCWSSQLLGFYRWDSQGRFQARKKSTCII